MHPRNQHGAHYDFARLIRSSPQLATFVRANPYGDDSVDFGDPVAVMALNRALLREFYGIAHWEIPTGYLCPPVPGRADYIHHAADLLATSANGQIPHGKSVRMLDVGVGANCIYPLIGAKEYGWRFVGSDIDPIALESAQRIIDSNPPLRGMVELRVQRKSPAIFSGIIQRGERFDLTICNPPFHASAEEAAAGTQRKLRNLGKSPRVAHPVLNFGGQSHELWCRGGELAFLRRMISESVERADSVLWFSSLISSRENLPGVYSALKAARPSNIRTIPMAQGQKQSRIVAWTFLGPVQHQAWVRGRSL